MRYQQLRGCCLRLGGSTQRPDGVAHVAWGAMQQAAPPRLAVCCSGALQQVPVVSPADEQLASARKRASRVVASAAIKNEAAKARNKAAKQLDTLMKVRCWHGSAPGGSCASNKHTQAVLAPAACSGRQCTLTAALHRSMPSVNVALTPPPLRAPTRLAGAERAADQVPGQVPAPQQPASL